MTLLSRLSFLLLFSASLSFAQINVDKSYKTNGMLEHTFLLDQNGYKVLPGPEKIYIINDHTENLPQHILIYNEEGTYEGEKFEIRSKYNLRYPLVFPESIKFFSDGSPMIIIDPTQGNMEIVKLNKSFVVDSSFGSNGRLNRIYFPFSLIEEIYIDSQDNIFVVGWELSEKKDNYYLNVTKYYSDGSLDQDWGVNGKFKSDSTIEYEDDYFRSDIKTVEDSDSNIRFFIIDERGIMTKISLDKYGNHLVDEPEVSTNVPSFDYWDTHYNLQYWDVFNDNEILVQSHTKNRKLEIRKFDKNLVEVTEPEFSCSYNIDCSSGWSIIQGLKDGDFLFLNRKAGLYDIFKFNNKGQLIEDYGRGGLITLTNLYINNIVAKYDHIYFTGPTVSNFTVGIALGRFNMDGSLDEAFCNENYNYAQTLITNEEIDTIISNNDRLFMMVNSETGSVDTKIYSLEKDKNFLDVDSWISEEFNPGYVRYMDNQGRLYTIDQVGSPQEYFNNYELKLREADFDGSGKNPVRVDSILNPAFITLPDSSILLAGWKDMKILNLDHNFRKVSDWGDGGFKFIPDNENKLVKRFFQGDNYLIILSEKFNNPEIKYLTKIDYSGQLDQSFGVNGHQMFETENYAFIDVYIHSDGSIFLLFNEALGNNLPIIMKFDISGNIVTDYGIKGTLKPFESISNHIRSTCIIPLDNDEKLIAGISMNNDEFFFFKLQSDGTLDSDPGLINYKINISGDVEINGQYIDSFGGFFYYGSKTDEESRYKSSFFIKFIYGNNVSVKDFENQQDGIIIFPNPAKSDITIDLGEINSLDIKSISLVDINGQSFDKSAINVLSNSELIICSNSLNSGSYYFELILNNGKKINGSFVINK